jgi:hypothetical protein
MAVMVEIKTGSRMVIGYLLSPPAGLVHGWPQPVLAAWR